MKSNFMSSMFKFILDYFTLMAREEINEVSNQSLYSPETLLTILCIMYISGQWRAKRDRPLAQPGIQAKRVPRFPVPLMLDPSLKNCFTHI
jgi:hypothetical protein